MNPTEAVFQIALTLVPHIGHVHAKTLADTFHSASGIFNASLQTLESITGIGTVRAHALKKFRDFRQCEQILKQVEDLGAETLFLTDSRYPQRLLHCYDPPTLLYFKGSFDLNHKKKLAIVGTRHHTEYGRLQTASVINALRQANPAIVSGLAYGIDGLAHRAALKNGLPTLGILAHGLHTIYPPEHRLLAAEIIAQKGGLITEFPPGIKPDRFNFPIRNRIVAGLSDALLVIETGKRGGSMITAGLAHGYDCPVYALPGKIGDHRSEGCNFLIHSRIANLCFDTESLLADLQWSTAIAEKKQLPILFELDAAETILVNLLGTHPVLSIDDLYLLSGLPAGTAASTILGLELRNIIRSLPGKRYQRCI